MRRDDCLPQAMKTIEWQDLRKDYLRLVRGTEVNGSVCGLEMVFRVSWGTWYQVSVDLELRGLHNRSGHDDVGMQTKTKNLPRLVNQAALHAAIRKTRSEIRAFDKRVTKFAAKYLPGVRRGKENIYAVLHSEELNV